MTREEIYQEAKAKRKQEKEKPKGGFGGFEQPEWHAIETNYSQVRFVGNYPMARHGDPTAAKIINVAMIVGDDGKKFRCIYPLREERKDWIMWRIFNKVADSTWDKNSKTRKYKHEGSPCLHQVLTNGLESNYEAGWYPKSVVVTNVIARDRMQWHRENKKTLLLSKKVGYSKTDGTPFYEIGFPAGSFKELLIDGVVEYSGDWEMYDVLIKRMSEKPYYSVLHATDDKKKFVNELSTFSYYEQMALAPLTQEELSWERYDIDRMFPVTSYTKLHNHLGIWIRKIDAEFRTNFSAELEELAAEESAKWAAEEARNPSSAASATESEDEEDGENYTAEATASSMEEAVSTTSEYSAPTSVSPAAVVTPPPPASRAATPAPASRRATSVGLDWTKLAQTHKGVGALTPEEKACITSVNPDGSFVYNVPAGVNANCLCEDETTCRFITPDSFHVCPKCGILFGTNGQYADVPF